ncbi:MAG TPA: YeeE/YedE family protein [Polyangia bacterium]
MDLAHFTPIASLAGGVLIGTAAALLWIINGRIAGISGIVGELLTPTRGDARWRLGFVAGLVGGGTLVRWIHPASFALPHGSTTLLVASGVLVGFGTRLANGCTSGHGVCGVSRLSPRSLAATGIFMAAGIATVYVVRHVAGVQ